MQGRIHRLRDGDELVCRVQTDLGLETAYILCAPVVPRDTLGALIPKLHIPFDLAGEIQLILMSRLVAIPGNQIGPAIFDASAHRDDIIAATDLLVSGF